MTCRSFPAETSLSSARFATPLAQTLETLRSASPCCALSRLAESRQAQAQRTAHQQLIRQGRTRFLRARRTRNLSIGAGSGLESGSTGAGSASPAFGTPATPLSQDNQQQQISLFATPLQTGFAPAALNAHATDVAGTQQAPWQAPAAVVFTMGWWETPSKGSRRRRAAQRLRTAMHAGGFAAPAAPAQATLVR